MLRKQFFHFHKGTYNKNREPLIKDADLYQHEVDRERGVLEHYKGGLTRADGWPSSKYNNADGPTNGHSSTRIIAISDRDTTTSILS